MPLNKSNPGKQVAHPVQCRRCRLSEPLCICNRITEVPISFEIVIVRHPSEAYRSSNSARLADLCIPQVRLISSDSANISFSIDTDWLLFPTYNDSPKASLSQLPKRLFVLDGTWRQARRMRKRLGFNRLPHFQPSPMPTPPPRIRKPSFEGGMSTMESICAVIAEIEGKTQANALLTQLSDWVNAVARLTGIEEIVLPGQCFTDVRRQTKPLFKDQLNHEIK